MHISAAKAELLLSAKVGVIPQILWPPAEARTFTPSLAANVEIDNIQAHKIASI